MISGQSRAERRVLKIDLPSTRIMGAPAATARPTKSGHQLETRDLSLHSFETDTRNFQDPETKLRRFIQNHERSWMKAAGMWRRSG